MTEPRRRHSEQRPLRRIDPTNPRVVGMALDALRFRAMRTTHYDLLYSGGALLATLPPGITATIVGGPVVVAGVVYWRMGSFAGLEGWVAADDLQDWPDRSPALGASVTTGAHKTYVRERPGGSPQKVRKCAGECHHADILIREPEPIDRHRRLRIKGSLPKIYVLSNGGADLLTDMYGVPRGRIDWLQKNRGLLDPQLLHALYRADVMVPLEVDARASGDVHFIDTPTLIARSPEATQHDPNPHIWRIERERKGKTEKLSATPDKYFAFALGWRPEGSNRRHFVVEIDRAKMPDAREVLNKQSSIIKKIIVFSEAYKQKLHQERYGIQHFRVLIATTSRQRIHNMLTILEELAKEFGYSTQLFYFNDFDTLKQAPNSLLVPWITLRQQAKDTYTPVHVSLLAERFADLPPHYQSAKATTPIETDAPVIFTRNPLYEEERYYA